MEEGTQPKKIMKISQLVFNYLIVIYLNEIIVSIISSQLLLLLLLNY